MATIIRQGRTLKIWLQEINRFHHVNTLAVDKQRLATRIYLLLFTVTIIGLSLYTLLSVQEYTTIIKSPSLKDFMHLQSLQSAKLSCPCNTITIPFNGFITLKPVFHPVCSSPFVTRTWSDAIFFENASTYLPIDIRSTLSAQYQLLSSLCELAQQTVNDALQTFEATQFISTQVILNQSFQIQINALTAAFKSSASSSLLRALMIIRKTTSANQFVSAISSTSAAILLEYFSQYYVGIGVCNYNTQSGDTCQCYESYECHMPVGVFNITMSTNMPTGCTFNVSITDSFIIFNGFYAGCVPLESLLTSTLACLYDTNCLEVLQQYLAVNINISVLTLPVQGQFTHDSNIMEIINELFVHEWYLNISYDAYYAACAPITCSYTYTTTSNLAYIIATLLGLYGGLVVVLEVLIVFGMKYWQRRNNRPALINNNRSRIETLHVIFVKLKKAIIELNLFTEKDTLTINQQIMTTRIFFLLVSSAVFVLILFSILTTRTYIEKIDLPTQIDFERLEILYPNTLSCPCSEIIISQKEFIKLSPDFHPICSSDFVSDNWFNAINRAISTGDVSFFLDFRYIALSNFIQLKSFCALANQTIQDSLAIFNETPFISSQALPVSVLNIESDVLLTTYQQLTVNMFSLQIKFIQNTSYGNQLFSSLLSNAVITAITSNANDIEIKLVSANYSTSDATTCSCILDSFSCASPSAIYGNVDLNTNQAEILVPMPSFLLGCFAIDSLFLSTLECFYNQSCLDILQPYIPYFNMTALNVSQLNQYKPNTKIGEIIENLLVKKWNTFISFEKYFSACAPQLCTYSYEQRENLIFFLTTLFSLFGGLTAVFGMISPYITLIISQRFQHHIDTPYNIRIRNMLLYLRSVPSQIWNNIVNLNLFIRRGQQQDEQSIRLHRQTTRLYLCILIITLIILGIYRIISNYTFSKSIQNPTQITFERLYSQYGDILSCPCSQIGMDYSEFVDIKFTFHSICSSDFITQAWLSSVFTTDNFTYSDFRLTAFAHFQLLKSLCQLANATLVNACSSFLTKKFVSTKVISSDSFHQQIEATIQAFQLNTKSSFIQLLELIRDTTSGNALITVYTSSWKYVAMNMDAYSTVFTRPLTYDHENGTCSCGTFSDCSQPAAVYIDTESIIIRGIRVGCYPLNAVLQSTLECFYNQSCVDLLRDIFNIPTSFSATDYTISSHFYPNVTVYSLANELLVENWEITKSYEEYFSTCASSTCSYSYSQRANLVYVLTTLFGLYGGLSISLRLLSPILMNVFKRIIGCVMTPRGNIVMPVN